MTNYTHRTMIVAAAYAPMARALAIGLAGDGGEHMWETGLSADGSYPATHYVSTGLIVDTFAALLADAATLYAACQAAGAGVTLEQCQALLANSDVSEDEPFDAFARLGLQLATPELPQ